MEEIKQLISPQNKKWFLTLNNRNIADIIKWFRIQMLPDIGGNGNFFTPPNYFEIQYFINGVEAEYMHKIKPSVL